MTDNALIAEMPEGSITDTEVAAEERLIENWQIEVIEEGTISAKNKVTDKTFEGSVLDFNLTYIQ